MESVLAEEIRRPEYGGLSDQQIADAVNAKQVVSRRLVPTWEVRRAAIEGGYWANLVFAASSNDQTVRAAAVNVLAWIDDQSGTIQAVDFDRPSTKTMIQGLIAFGLITQQQADSLCSLADISIPWTQSVGLPEVGIGLVQNARRSISG